MFLYFWVGIAGFVGAIVRYGLSGYISSKMMGAFPWGTFIINVSGSLLLGFLATLGLQSALVPSQLRQVLTVGFVGSYTTFSTWTFETLRLMEAGSYLLAAANVAGSTLAGLIGVWGGTVMARLLS